MEGDGEDGGALVVDGIGCEGLSDAGDVADDCIVTMERAEADGGVSPGSLLTPGSGAELVVVAAEM